MNKKLSDLIPDHANANKGTQRGRAALESSLRQYGAGRSILVDRNGHIIAGNKTAEVAADIGMDNVIVVQTDGTQIIAVQRTDLDIDSETGRGLAYADNRVGELSLDWNAEQVLADLDAGVNLSGIFDKEELDELLSGLKSNDDVADAEPQVDRADELRQQWQVEPGQLWQLGEHRLICGDCTDAEVVGKVLQGEKPMLMVTDPPYGVNYDANWRNEAAEAGLLSFSLKRRTGIVTNDDRVDWSSAYALFPGDVIYAWSPGGDNLILTGLALQKAEFQIRYEIIWVKPHFPISRGHYTYQHELCWYAVRKGGQAHWIGPKNASTTWKISLDKNVNGGHSTQKPLDCMKIPISNHQGDVYEPFLGSGTTLMACEQLGRRCLAIEISPAYVAVALERWHVATGKMPTRL